MPGASQHRAFSLRHLSEVAQYEARRRPCPRLRRSCRTRGRETFRAHLESPRGPRQNTCDRRDQTLSLQHRLQSVAYATEGREIRTGRSSAGIRLRSSVPLDECAVSWEVYISSLNTARAASEEVNFELQRCEMTEAQIRDARVLATRICASHTSHLCSSMLQFYQLRGYSHCGPGSRHCPRSTSTTRPDSPAARPRGSASATLP